MNRSEDPGKIKYSFLKFLNGLATPVEKRIEKLEFENFSNKFFAPDPSLWTNDPSETEEVFHRMGWIDAPLLSRKNVLAAEKLLSEIKNEGYSHALVVGMGGSSLAPEVFANVFINESGVHLSILDSTDPSQIDEKVKEIPIDKTLFIISSKSGTTAEVRALFAYFWNLVEKIDKDRAGDHFIAITDPGTMLEKLGKEKKFRRIFDADADVGGRFSALIAFGIIPAVLAGVNGNTLLDSANRMREMCSQSMPIDINPGFILGAILAEANLANRDKLTILTDERFCAFGSWLEQLIAESSGKDGKGIVPIDSEPIIAAREYSKDRIFYYLRSDGELDEFINTLIENNLPVVVSQVDEEYDLGAEIYKWEIAISAGCSIIGVNPFNQPNVQQSKTIANEMIDAYKQNPILKEENILFSDSSFAVFGRMEKNIAEKYFKTIILQFLAPATGDFIAINAFLPRNDLYTEKLQQLRESLLNKYHVPVTLGFGPRFLHSTGQLHKGGRNNGIFLVISQDSTDNIQIPGEGMSFSTLEKAQTLGDMKALEQNGRRVVRVHLKLNALSLISFNRMLEDN